MQLKDNNREKDTTITVSQDTAKKIENLAKSEGLTKKEFLKKATEYFIKNSVSTSDELGTKELQKIIKRQDQFFAFFKKQENDLIRPILLQLAEIKRDIYKQDEQIQEDEVIAEKTSAGWIFAKGYKVEENKIIKVAMF